MGFATTAPDDDLEGETNDSSGSTSTSVSFDYDEDPEPTFDSTSTSTTTTTTSTTTTDDSGGAAPAPDLSGEVNDSSSETTGDLELDSSSEPAPDTTDSDMSTINTTATDNSMDNRLAAYIDLQTSPLGNTDEQLLGGAVASDILGNVTQNMDVARQFAQDVAQESTPSMPDLEGAQERAQNIVVELTGANQGTSRLVVLGAAAVAGVAALGSLVGLASEG